jgi:hypothetical protein
MTWPEPATLNPVTEAVWPDGVAALLSTLPLMGWSMGVEAVSGAYVYSGVDGLDGWTVTLSVPGLLWPSLLVTVYMMGGAWPV